MTAPVRLPVELLAHIVSYLRTDHAALRNLCLASSALHAVSYPLLFAARDFRKLDYPWLDPFLPLVLELRIAWRPDMHRGRDPDVLAASLAPRFSPAVLPRLEHVAIRGIGTDGMAYLVSPPLCAALASFKSLTRLTLNETYHRDMRDVQCLLTALPRLAHLHLNAVTWLSPEYNFPCPPGSPSAPATELSDRPALKSLRVSPVYPSCMLPLLAWLGHTPTAHTLRTLDVPAPARIGSDALLHFGASVRRLAVPLRGLKVGSPSSCSSSPVCAQSPVLPSLKGYTALAELALYVGIDDFLTRQYARLPDVLASLPSAGTLRSLELHLPFEATLALGGSLDILARVDEVLFGGEEGTNATFEQLGRLELVLQSTRALDDRGQERKAPEGGRGVETDWGERLGLRRARASGRLEVRFDRDESMAHAFACRPGSGPSMVL